MLEQMQLPQEQQRGNFPLWLLNGTVIKIFLFSLPTLLAHFQNPEHHSDPGTENQTTWTAESLHE